jgi:hypothetical protein
MIRPQRLIDFINDPRFLWRPEISTTSLTRFCPRVGGVTFDIEENYFDKSPKGIEIFLTKVELILRKYKVRATFFVQGELIESFGAILRSLSNKGHEIGVHGYTHQNWGNFVWFWNEPPLSLETKRNHLAMVRDLFSKNRLPEPKSFRAPNLNINRESLRLLRGFNYLVDSSWPSFRAPGQKKQKVAGITQIPLTSLAKPRIIRKIGILPVRDYYPLNFCNVQKMSSSELKSYIDGLSSNCFVFLAHPWEFETDHCYTILEEMIARLSFRNEISWQTMTKL